MADIFTTVTNFINSPPGQLTAGATLAGIVWKFFERVESVLNDDAKLEIAVWLLGVKPLSSSLQESPETFAKLFDRVFGTKHLSWKCFWRSCIASVTSVLVSWLLMGRQFALGDVGFTLAFNSIFLALALVPDYLSLLKTRRLINLLKHQEHLAVLVRVLMLDCVLGLGLALIAPMILLSVAGGYVGPFLLFFLIPNIVASLFTSIWLWLYAGSGFLLRAARRFDIGFQWFNRHADIEKKPLQSIGLLAGALVAVLYWAAAIVSRVV